MVLTEGPLEREFDLQAAFVIWPEVLPAEDLGLGTLVSIGWELNLGAGPMDQLAVDRLGQLVIVEFKKGSESRHRRRAIAQLVDYAAVMDRISYDTLQSACQRNAGKHRYSRVCPGEDLATHVSHALVDLGESPLDVKAFQRGVSNALRDGAFVLAYIARDLDARTARGLTFLGERAGFATFAITLDNFKGATFDQSVLIPRVAYVSPRMIARREGVP
jgi:hypothetical protein